MGYAKIDGWKRNVILAKDDYQCVYCGVKANKFEIAQGVMYPSIITESRTLMLQIDHIIPVSMGGSSNLENLCACCSVCNRIKVKTPLKGKRIRTLKNVGVSINSGFDWNRLNKFLDQWEEIVKEKGLV